MHRRFRNIFSLLLAICILMPALGWSGVTLDDKKLEVALRMVGHRVLLNSGDSTSRVLPVKKDNDHYVVRFDTEFEFVGEDIVLWVREAIQESSLKMGYIVEVVSCEDEEVVYSYQHGDVKDPDIIPCKSRPLPLDCYKLYFTPLDEQNLMASSEEVHPPKDGSGELLDRLSLLPVILAALVIGILLFFGVRRFRTKEDENIISLGNYKFDTLNTVLLLDKERTELTSKEADLLLLLYKAVNSTIERGDILQKVWGGGDEYIGRTLDVFISKLRKKLSADPGVKIVNVRGVGYKLIVDQ